MNKISYIISTCNCPDREQAYMAANQKNVPIPKTTKHGIIWEQNPPSCLSLSAVKKLNSKNWHHFGTFSTGRTEVGVQQAVPNEKRIAFSYPFPE